MYTSKHLELDVEWEVWVCSVPVLAVDPRHYDPPVRPVERVHHLHLLLAQAEVEELSVLVDPRRRHRLWDHHQPTLDLVKQ